MLDFGSLEYIFAEDQKTEKTYSFVGIKNQNGLKNLFLPLGFKSESLELDDSYSTKKDLFFLLYRALRKYTGRLKQYNKDRKQSANNRDGAGEGATTNTFSIETDEGTEEIVYTRFSGLDDVLDGYDELRLFAMRERMRRSDKIDYSNIHRYLDKAVYLPDDTIFIDEVETPKPTLGCHTTDLVRMYCYIYSEIKREMDESNDISPEVAAEAENFQEEHLSPNDSLFDEESHTGDILRDQLERIDEQTAFKDDAYWHFYEAVEAVLYPQRRIEKSDGTHWGINNFCFVWEDMCQDILHATDPNGILYADAGDWHPKGTLNNLITQENCLTFSLNGGKPKTVIKPDAVILNRTWFLLRRERMFTINISPLEIQDGKLHFTLTKKQTSSETSEQLILQFYDYNDYSHKVRFKFDLQGKTVELPIMDLFFFNQKVTEINMEITAIQQLCKSNRSIVAGFIPSGLPDEDFLMEWLWSMHDAYVFIDYFQTLESIPEKKFSYKWKKSRYQASLRDDVLYREKKPRKDPIKSNNGVVIVDFKYKQSEKFKSKDIEEPEREDIRKQHIYELAIKHNVETPAIKNALIMPGDNNHEELLENKGIWLVTWNARETLESYIGGHQS